MTGLFDFGVCAPYWVARAHVLGIGGAGGRNAALQRAIGLTYDPRLRDFLVDQLA